MTAKSVVGFILGGALASGIWGIVHFYNTSFIGVFIATTVLSGIMALEDNWE